MSALTRAWKWPLIQAHLLSCAVEREGRCKQMPPVCVGSTHSKWNTWRFPQAKMARTSQAAQAHKWARRAQSQVADVSHQGSCSQAVTLSADMSHPESQENMIRDWRPAHSLAGDAVSVVKMAETPSFSASGYCSPVSLPPERATNGSWLALLWYLLRHSPLFCGHARGHSAVLELSWGNGPLFFFFFSPPLVFIQFEFYPSCLCFHISSFRVSSQHSILDLFLRKVICWWLLAFC